MLDINSGELLVLAAVGVIVLGPERLPQYAAQLGKLVRQARSFARTARAQMRDELGEDFDDIDWQSLDPRRYDPRRIVRDALLDDDDEPVLHEPRSGQSSSTRSDGTQSNGTQSNGTQSNGTAGVDLTKATEATAEFDPDAT